MSKLGVLPRVARLIWGNDFIACSLGFAQSPLLGLNNSRLLGAARTAHRHSRSGLLAYRRFHCQIRPFQLHFSHLRLAIPSYKVSRDFDTSEKITTGAMISTLKFCLLQLLLVFGAPACTPCDIDVIHVQ